MDLVRIELTTLSCEDSGIPLTYRPEEPVYYTRKNLQEALLRLCRDPCNCRGRGCDLGADELPNHRAQPEHEGKCDNKHPPADYHEVVFGYMCLVVRRVMMYPTNNSLFHINLVCSISRTHVNPQFLLGIFIYLLDSLFARAPLL